MIFFFHKWLNKLFTEEDNVPSKQFKARKVAGSATYKQYEIVLSFKISLFIQLV